MKYCLCLVLILAWLAAPAHAGTYKNAEQAFSIVLPEGWSEMEPPMIESAAETFSTETTLHCFAGFQNERGAVLLLSAEPYPDADTHTAINLAGIQHIAMELSKSKQAELHSAAGPAIPNLGAGMVRQATYITNPPGLILDTLRPQQAIRGHQIAFFGQDHVVWLHFFTTADEYANLRHDIDGVAESFQFGPTQALSTQTEFSDPADYTRTGVYVFVGIALLGAGILAVYMLRRRAY